MELSVGQIVEAVVTNIASFGAFVQVPEAGNKEGMVHISEIADAYINDINKFLKVGESVRLKVIDIKPDGKIYFSIKQVRTKPDVSFEDKISEFLKQSEEKQLDIKKNLQEKTGQRKKTR